MEKCDICGKEEKYDNCVWYSEEAFNLCRKHHRAWLKEHKPYRETHKYIKPQTKEHKKMCKEEEKLFKKWFSIQDSNENKKCKA